MTWWVWLLLAVAVGAGAVTGLLIYAHHESGHMNELWPGYKERPKNYPEER